VVVDLEEHGLTTYEMFSPDVPPVIGERVRCEYGMYAPKQYEGVVVAIQEDAIVSCPECGVRRVRLPDGRWTAPYYGDCKRAWPLTEQTRGAPTLTEEEWLAQYGCVGITRAGARCRNGGWVVDGGQRYCHAHRPEEIVA
jgi:hypothetical protein